MYSGRAEIAQSGRAPVLKTGGENLGSSNLSLGVSFFDEFLIASLQLLCLLLLSFYLHNVVTEVRMFFVKPQMTANFSVFPIAFPASSGDGAPTAGKCGKTGNRIRLTDTSHRYLM